MGVENEVRNVETGEAKKSSPKPSSVANVVLADESGVIQLTLWRQEAVDIFPIIDKALEEAREGFCAKLEITHLVLRDVRCPSPNVRILHSILAIRFYLIANTITDDDS